MATLSSRLARLEKQQADADAALLARLSDATFNDFGRRLEDLLQTATLDQIGEDEQCRRLVELRRWLKQRATEEGF